MSADGSLRAESRQRHRLYRRPCAHTAAKHCHGAVARRVDEGVVLPCLALCSNTLCGSVSKKSCGKPATCCGTKTAGKTTRPGRARSPETVMRDAWTGIQAAVSGSFRDDSGRRAADPADGARGTQPDGDDRPESLEELIDELQPYDIAYVLQQLDGPEQLELLALTPPRLAAEALEHLDFELQYRLLDHVGEAHARAILAEMPLHHLVMLVNAVHPLRAQVLLRMVPDDARAAHRPNADAAGGCGGSPHQRATFRGPGRLDDQPSHRPLSQSRAKRGRDQLRVRRRQSGAVRGRGVLSGRAAEPRRYAAARHHVHESGHGGRGGGAERKRPACWASTTSSRCRWSTRRGGSWASSAPTTSWTCWKRKPPRTSSSWAAPRPLKSSYLDTTVGTLFRSRVSGCWCCFWPSRSPARSSATMKTCCSK